jgi:hypothetical protein
MQLVRSTMLLFAAGCSAPTFSTDEDLRHVQVVPEQFEFGHPLENRAGIVTDPSSAAQIAEWGTVAVEPRHPRLAAIEVPARAIVTGLLSRLRQGGALDGPWTIVSMKVEVHQRAEWFVPVYTVIVVVTCRSESDSEVIRTHKAGSFFRGDFRDDFVYCKNEWQRAAAKAIVECLADVVEGRAVVQNVEKMSGR